MRKYFFYYGRFTFKTFALLINQLFAILRVKNNNFEPAEELQKNLIFFNNLLHNLFASLYIKTMDGPFTWEIDFNFFFLQLISVQ